MANTTLVSIGWIVLLSGLIALGFTIYALVFGFRNPEVINWMNNCSMDNTPGKGCNDPIHNAFNTLMNVVYPSAYGMATLSIGMSLVGVALIMLGSSPAMLGGRR